MKHLALILGIPCLLFLAGCGEGRLKPSEFIRWAEAPENGLRTQEVGNQIAYTLQYKPTEYIVSLEEKTDVLDSKIFEKRKSELDGLEYFNLRMEPVDRGHDVVTLNLVSNEAYTERVEYFSFGMQEDVKLVNGSDTLQCELFQFVQNYGIGPYADFVLGFEKDELPANQNDLQILLTDRIFGNGTISLNLAQAALRELPELITD